MIRFRHFGFAALAMIAGCVGVASAQIMVSGTLPPWTVGVPYPANTLTATGAIAYTWQITPSGTGLSPSFPTVDTSVINVIGTPTSPGPFTVTAMDSLGMIASGAIGGTINAAPSITTPALLPATTVGATYTKALAASGGTAPLTWAVTGSPLPSGVGLSSAGLLSGSWPTAGSPSFTAQVTDAAGATASLTFSITVNAAPSITTASPLPAVTVGSTSYSQTLVATGGTAPFTWSISGPALPTGVTLSAGGVLSSASWPSPAGTVNLTAQVTDSQGVSATKAFSITVNAALSITTTSPLAATTMGAAYNKALAVTGGTAPLTWAITGTPLPSGMTLSSAGVLSGLWPAAGTPGFAAQVTDSGGGITSKAFTITVNSAPVITTTTPLPATTVGSTTYSTTLIATGGTAPLSFAVTGTPLPAGVTLSSSGVLSSASWPSPAGTLNFTAQVTDSANVGVSKAFSLTVNPAPTISTAPTLPSGVIGSPYSAVTLSATGGTGPFSWSIISGSLPPPLTFNGTTGTINAGTPTSSGTFNFTAQISDAAGVKGTKAFTIQIQAGLSITTAPTLPPGAVGTAYSQTLSAAGGTAPYTWSINIGALPGGLTLNSSTGAITGTPTASGTFGFTVQLADSASGGTFKAFSLTVAGAIGISNAPALPPATVGAAYSQTLTATGGTVPYIWSIFIGSLPGGLTLNPNSGAITGTPTTAGAFSFTAKVTDSASLSAIKAFTLNVTNGLTIVTGPTLPSATVGGSYSVTLAATGGTPPYHWSISGGSPPPGITINALTGTLSGSTNSSGTFNFIVQVIDNASLSATKPFSLAVSAGLGISTAPVLPTGALSSAYSQTFTAVGGSPPYSWSVNSGQLPAGLGLNPGTGILSGTPTGAGNFSFVIRVTDTASASANKQFSLTIVGGLTITTAPSLPDGTIGATYSQALNAAGGSAPYSWSITAGSLPAGLGLNPSSGLISGKATSVGTSTFTATVTDSSSASVNKQFTLKISSDLTITTPLPLSDGALGKAYSVTLAAAGGKSPYGWSVKSGSLPPGISLSSAGALTGQPTSAGDSSFTVQVTDNVGATFTKDFTIHVSASSLPGVTVGGLPDTVDAGSQNVINVTLDAPYPSQITGQITLAFQPDATAPADDPALQFSTGGRSATFTIPANTTQAIFTQSTLALQTGTVAGTITVTTTLQPAAQPVTKTNTVKIARAAPSIRTVTVATTTSGFEVHVTGWSTPRDMSSALVHFTPASGSNLQTTSLTVSLTGAGTQWFAGAQSAQFGSQFTLVLPFTVSGPAAAVASVSVTLTNSVGTSHSGSANF